MSKPYFAALLLVLASMVVWSWAVPKDGWLGYVGVVIAAVLFVVSFLIVGWLASSEP